MRKIGFSLTALGALALAGAASGNGQILWDNDIVPNGFNGRALSPPSFPDIRVADDFSVPAGGWSILDLHVSVVEDASWAPGDVQRTYIYSDRNGSPGAEIAVIDTGFDREFTGEVLFNREIYEYWVKFDDPINLDEGTYWLGFEQPNGGGSGTNYWLTSNGGEGTARTGWFSLDNGGTWSDQGPNWHMAFVLTPAPGALALLGLGGLFASRRRRR